MRSLVAPALPAVALLALMPACATTDWQGISRAIIDVEQRRAQTQPPAQEDWPCPSYDYRGSKTDPGSGNHYRWACVGAEIRVDGSNPMTGSTWHNYLSKNGNERGTDAQFRMWSYTEATGYYSRSDGRTCYGKGAARTCYGPAE